MNKIINVGWDPGRLNNKVYLEDGKRINMNAICSGYDRRILEKERGSLENFLDVDVYRGDKHLGRYFVGRMAYQYNRGDLRWSTSGIPKFSDVNHNYDEIIKMVTNLALTQFEANNPNKKAMFRVGTGSPTEEYFEKPHTLDKVTEMMNLPYRVVFKHELFKGAEIEVVVPKIYFKPEGTASIISMAFKDDLSKVPEVEEILNKGYKIIGINMGSSTSDVAIFKPNMEFDTNGFFGIDVGSSKALNEIRDILYSKYSYNTNKLKVDYLIRNYKKVSYRGEIIDLESLKEQPFNNTLALLKTKFYDEVEKRGIDLGEAGAFFVSGGTAILLEDRLETFIPGVPTTISVDPLYEDARGYYLEAKANELLEKSMEKEVFEGDDELHVVG